MKHLTLSIPSPCSENWNTFTPASQGRFCLSCSKVIIDFTGKSDAEIMEFFTRKPARTCGRFRTDQIREYSHKPVAHVRPGLQLFKAGLLSLLLVLVSKQTFAQRHSEKVQSAYVTGSEYSVGKVAVNESYVVRGVVIDSYDKSHIPGINIVLKGSTVGTTTDVNGYFEFPQRLKEGDVLLFSFIGYATHEYRVPKASTGEIEIKLDMDVEIMGEIAVDVAYSRPSSLSLWWQKVKALF